MPPDTKLRRAIDAGDAHQVTELLRGSSRLEGRWAKGWTPLHVAARRGKKDVVTAILQAGADINATTEMHQTPLDVAVSHDQKQLAEFLRKMGGRSGADLSLHSAAAAGNLKAVKKHLSNGADIDQLLNGKRSICISLEFRRWDVAQFLLNRKCDVTKRQQWGVTPLHVAAASEAPADLLSKILKLGAHIDAADNCQETPLCHAAEAGHRETVNWLLDHGADVTRGRDNATTPVYCALRRNHVELASHLIDRGGKSTLHQAVQCNHLARARQKLNSGADVNHEEDPHHMGSPLEVAIWLDSTDMVALLLEFGADPNQQDGSGNASLHEAVLKGSAKMVKLLLAHGADPDIAAHDGLTPMELARRRDRTHLANLMEAHLDKKLSLEATQSPIEPLYTIPKVAELLSVDDSFVLELIKAKKITCLKLDENTLRIPAGSIQRYLAKLSSKPAY
jgi:ankyrin